MIDTRLRSLSWTEPPTERIRLRSLSLSRTEPPTERIRLRSLSIEVVHCHENERIVAFTHQDSFFFQVRAARRR